MLDKLPYLKRFDNILLFNTVFRLSYGIIGNGVGEILLIRGKGIHCQGGLGGRPRALQL